MLQIIGTRSTDLEKIIRNIEREMELPDENIQLLLDPRNLQDNCRYKTLCGNPAVTLPSFARVDFSGPEDIRNRFQPDNCLVWISQRTCSGSVELFCFTLAHEFQHVRQAYEDPRTSKLGLLLNANIPDFDHTIDRSALPMEVDADMTAKRIVLGIFGPASLRALIEDQLNLPHPYTQKWSAVRDYNPNSPPYDFKAETHRWLCRYKSQFIGLETKEVEEPFIDEFDFLAECP